MPKHSIMLVDDEPANRDLASLALAELGLVDTILVAGNGEEAIGILNRQLSLAASPTVMLLDLDLPGRHGREVLAYSATHPDLKHIIVVILTTDEDPEECKRCLALGAAAYWNKPNSFDELVALLSGLRRWLP